MFVYALKKSSSKTREWVQDGNTDMKPKRNIGNFHMVPGFSDAKSALAHSFRPHVKLLQREDGTYGTFEHWTWYIDPDAEGAELWRQVIRHRKPSKKVIMPSEVAKKYFDETLGILKPERTLSCTF